MTDLEKLIISLKKDMQVYYSNIKEECYFVINNKITNVNYIEHLLDALMDCYYLIDDAKVTFDNLCSYLSIIDEKSAFDYQQIFKDSFEDEETNKKR